MADSAIGEEELVAWIDGELESPEAERVARAVAENPALAARAEAHRRLASRLQAAFAPIAEEPVALRVAPPPPVISLAEERARRERPPRRWALPGAIAASLLVGVLVGHQTWGGGAGVADRADALALAAPIGHALDTQLSGASGPVRIQLSFRDQAGDYCRSFTARHFGGVACRADGGWRLRYAAPSAAQPTDYRMAGEDAARAAAIGAMIAGAPLDAAQERAARAAGWR